MEYLVSQALSGIVFTLFAGQSEIVLRPTVGRRRSFPFQLSLTVCS